MIFQMVLFWSQKAYNWWVLGHMKLAESTGNHQPIPGLAAPRLCLGWPWVDRARPLVLTPGGTVGRVGWTPKKEMNLYRW